MFAIYHSDSSFIDICCNAREISHCGVCPLNFSGSNLVSDYSMHQLHNFYLQEVILRGHSMDWCHSDESFAASHPKVVNLFCTWSPKFPKHSSEFHQKVLLLHEDSPELGTRGCRFVHLISITLLHFLRNAILFPSFLEMQVRAILSNRISS